jgi:hypothetical protein
MRHPMDNGASRRTDKAPEKHGAGSYLNRDEPGNLNLLSLSKKSEWQQVQELVGPGISALSTRLAYLGLRGDLHTDVFRLQREIAAIKTPLSAELVDRMGTARSNGWLIREATTTELRGTEAGLYDRTEAGLYDPFAREILYSRKGTSMLAYVTGATTDHPRNAMVSVLSHEVGHTEGLKHFPLRFLEGQSTERVSAFRLLAEETNAFMAEMHVEQTRGKIIYTEQYTEALRNGELGARIYKNYYYQTPVLKSIASTEAKEFVNEYIAERWGNPLDSQGKVKSYSLNPTPEQIAESKRFDPERLKAMESDYIAERTEAGSESFRTRFARACQTRLGSATIHGAKVVGTVGACVAAHSVRKGFNQSFSSGLAESARVGVGLGGFELGAGFARLGYTTSAGKALLFGFIGAAIADRAIGAPVHNLIHRVLD